jgi:hypothetical protein
MPLCPAGHESAADDYCDACGRRMGVPTASATPAAPATPAAAPASGQPTRNEPAPSCPVCHTPRSGRFCEVCRFDFVAWAPTAAAPSPDGPPGGDTATPGPAWSAVVTADRAYFDRVTASGGPAAELPFPDHCPERRFALGRPRSGEERLIGRYSASRGINPEIDLTGPPTDPGISRMHAVLIGRPEGGWAVVDHGSENGTLVNDKELATGVEVPLHDGDRINLGAWTAITIRRG